MREMLFEAACSKALLANARLIALAAGLMFSNGGPVIAVETSAIQLFEQGFDFYSKHDYAAAEQAFKAGLKQGAASQDYVGLAHFYLGESLLAQESASREATIHYREAARLIPQKQEGRDAASKVEKLALRDECDRLAANVKDPDRPTYVPGVELRSINSPAAIKACTAAVNAFPDDRRLLFQVGLAYQAANKDSDSLPWFQRAAAAGSMRAMLNLGWMYEYGKGVATDYSSARKWYEKSAGLGGIEPLLRLGFMSEQGHGTKVDPAAARKFYETAASAGNIEAMIFLGSLYEAGKGVPVNNQEAARWYRKAAEAGAPWAMSLLANLYQNGKGVPHDLGEARRWYERAAAGGDRNAMLQLGDMYVFGTGVPVDFSLARKWYEQAAAAGLPEARKRLGVLNQKPERGVQ